MNKIIFLLLLFCLQNHYGQKAILKANGELIKLNDKHTNEAIIGSKIKSGTGESINNIILDARITNPQGIIDTLQYNDQVVFNTNFGFYDQNVMFQYFVAPADMIIKAAGFSTSDDAGSENATISLRLLKLNWTYEQLINVPAPLNIGVYPEDGDGLGGIDPFGEVATGNWKDLSGGLYPLPPWADNVDPAANNYNYDLWYNDWWPMSPVASPLDAKVYQWVIMSDLGFEPEVAKGEVFAVALTHDGTDPAFSDRIGFWADNSVGIPGWKYYEEGRFDAGDGWWVREYTWDFVVAVDLIGDRGPIINDVSRVLTTVSNDSKIIDAVITDDNPSGGDFGVKEAYLNFSVGDRDNFQKVKMVFSNNKYSAEIPPQTRGQYIYYFVEATDINGNSTTSKTLNYYIFPPEEKNLIIFHGLTLDEYPITHYFNISGSKALEEIYFYYDVWNYGPITKDLLDYYTNVFEFAFGYPKYYHRSLIREWLNEDPNRNYFLAGQDWLTIGGYGEPFQKGDFEYDILGIIGYPYHEVNHYGSIFNLTSELVPIKNSLLGNSLYEIVGSQNPDTLIYDPETINGETKNWIDAFEPIDSTNADLMVVGKKYDNFEVDTLVCAIHNVTANGNKVVFLSYDPISISSTSGFIYGMSEYSLQIQALYWFGILTDVENNEILDSLPQIFSLDQNYPNPFNPSTTIEYSIPLKVKSEKAKGSFIPSGVEGGKVKLTVYDVLGREVSTLVNRKQSPGNYKVTFPGHSGEGRNLSSGVYFYRLTHRDNINTKKMILLK